MEEALTNSVKYISFKYEKEPSSVLKYNQEESS